MDVIEVGVGAGLATIISNGLVWMSVLPGSIQRGFRFFKYTVCTNLLPKLE